MEVMQMKYHPKEVYYESRGNVHYVVLVYENGKVEHVIAAQQSVHPTLLTLCPECGVEQIVTHLPTCAHYVAQSG